MNSPTLGLHVELIKASTRAVERGYTCEAIAQAMRDYADALVDPPLALPVVPVLRTLGRGSSLVNASAQHIRTSAAAS